MDLRVLVVFTSLWSSGLLAEMKNSSTEIFRLVDGARRCHGELQMKQQDEDWKTVSWINWNLQLANRACAELNCGTALSIAEREETERNLWYMTMECDKSSLSDCFLSNTLNVPLELNCSDSVRLVHGSSLCSGRLEVWSNQSWVSVCEGDFDLQDAQVVCRELGCGAPLALQGVLYGEAEAFLWKTFQCEGDESAVLDCRSSASDACSSGEAVDVSCSDPVGVRLVDGDSQCDGSVQIEQHGEWRHVDTSSGPWMLKPADVICRQLDCGSALFTVTEEDYSSFHPLWVISSSCMVSTEALKDCVSDVKIILPNVMKLICSESVRLVHGSNLCSGRLEVRSKQSWSTVCEEDFDHNDAQVLCRELGCGAPSVLQGALYTEVEAPVWSQNFQCEGNESVLLNCRSLVSDTCSSGKAVDVSCTDPVGIRLVGGASRCDGSVQIEQHGDWRYVENYLYPLSLKAAAVMCRQLDCGSTVFMGRNNDSYNYVWLVSSSCVETTSTQRDCVSPDRSMTASFTLLLNCSDSVRLVHGSHLCSGRLEVWSNQSWSSVCEEDLDHNDAQVVCRELGCGSLSVLQGVVYGEEDAPVWSSEFQCEGNESVLLDCGRSSSVRKTCSSGKAVDVTCADPVRLVGQPSRCAGTLELENQSVWRPVGTSDQWSLDSGSAVCQSLDCGSAVSVNRRTDFPERPVWFISPTCVKSTRGLRDCLAMSRQGNLTSGLDLVCSDLLPKPIISLSVSADGSFEVYQRGFRLLIGSDFTITCSVEPQYQGGSFQLISNTSKPHNLTLAAVNHSAHFLFYGIGHAHRGDYTCVYHVNVFNHSFASPQSPALYLTIGAAVIELIIRTVLVIVILIISNVSIFFYCKATRGQFRLKAGAASGPL